MESMQNPSANLDYFEKINQAISICGEIKNPQDRAIVLPFILDHAQAFGHTIGDADPTAAAK